MIMAIKVCHGISAKIFESMKACHEYVFDGRSRASYSARCVTK
jgi:hypothetical protein